MLALLSSFALLLGMGPHGPSAEEPRVGATIELGRAIPSCLPGHEHPSHPPFDAEGSLLCDDGDDETEDDHPSHLLATKPLWGPPLAIHSGLTSTRLRTTAEGGGDPRPAIRSSRVRC